MKNIFEIVGEKLMVRFDKANYLKNKFKLNNENKSE
jgi:hypothetical protein